MLNEIRDRQTCEFARDERVRLSMNVADNATTVRITLRKIDRARGADQNLTP